MTVRAGEWCDATQWQAVWRSHFYFFVYYLSWSAYLQAAMSEQIRVGLEVNAVYASELGEQLVIAKQAGYNFVTAPLTNVALKHDILAPSAQVLGAPENHALKLHQVVLDGVEWADSVVGRHALWADLNQADMSAAAEMVLQRESDWATHLGMPATILVLLCKSTYSSGILHTTLDSGTHDSANSRLY
jgi:hypothetical protein